MIRDFTKNSIDSFRDDLKEYKGEKDLFGLNTRFEDYDILCELDIVHCLDDVKNYGKSVVSKYKTADKKLDGILKQVETVDANYAARFDAVYGRMKAFHQQIKNFTTIMTPEAIDLGEQYYGDYVKTFQDLYAAEVAKSEKKLEELENLSAVYDTKWYEDVISGVGGFFVSLARDEIEGYLFVGTLLSNFIGKGALSTEGSENNSKVLDYLEREYLNDLYANKTWYYGGRSFGDMTSMAIGVVEAAQGLLALSQCVVTGGAATGAALVGGGVLGGAAAGTVSLAVAGVAAAVVADGASTSVASMKNFKDNWDKFEKSRDGGSKGGPKSVDDIFNNGKKVLDNFDMDSAYVKPKHLSTTGGNGQKFLGNSKAEAEAILKDAMKNGTVKSITDNGFTKAGNASYEIIIDAGKEVGTRGETLIKIVLSEDGGMLSAFPIK